MMFGDVEAKGEISNCKQIAQTFQHILSNAIRFFAITVQGDAEGGRCIYDNTFDTFCFFWLMSCIHSRVPGPVITISMRKRECKYLISNIAGDTCVPCHAMGCDARVTAVQYFHIIKEISKQIFYFSYASHRHIHPILTSFLLFAIRRNMVSIINCLSTK